MAPFVALSGKAEFTPKDKYCEVAADESDNEIAAKYARATMPISIFVSKVFIISALPIMRE
jgi:hypothetical protein